MGGGGLIGELVRQRGWGRGAAGPIKSGGQGRGGGEGQLGEGRVTRGSGALGRAVIRVEEIWEECPGGSNLKGGGNCG